MMMLDRQRLSQDGFIVALIPVNSKNKLVGEPEIISRGFVPVNASSDLWQAARKEIQQQFKQGRRGGSGQHPRDAAELLLPRDAVQTGDTAEYHSGINKHASNPGVTTSTGVFLVPGRRGI